MVSKQTNAFFRATIFAVGRKVLKLFLKYSSISTPFRGYRLVALAAVCLLTAGSACASDMSPLVSDRLQSMADKLQINGKLSALGIQIETNRVLIDMYARAHYQALWQEPSTVRKLIAEIEQSRLDGLKPEDYHYHVLASVVSGAATGTHTASETAERELVLSDALIRLSFNLYFGKVDPRAQNSRWPLPAYIGTQKAAALLTRQIAAGRIDAFIGSLRPSHLVYRRLVTALSRYHSIADKGGWPEIPAGPLIEKGDRDPRVPLIRQRLLATGDLPATSVHRGDYFDEDLVDATARFQDRHRIDTFAPGSDDSYGAVGEDTREQMNVPVAHRIDQIRVNLERARWVLHYLPSTYLIADIADFSVVLVDEDQMIWRSRVQVGDAYRKTPVFRSKIRFMEINPTWTVPPGILDSSLLPGLRKDPHAKRLGRYVVYDRNGKPVDDPAKIPWNRYTGRTLPYRLVQRPGPDNPMGRIKFIFPNPDFVFIHDTPDRDFFDLERRDLSAGCIRIENPFELAAILMRLDGQEDEERLQTLLKSGRTGRINLNDPFPVILFYGTVSVDAKGNVAFRPDIYGRDPELLDALDAPTTLWRKTAHPSS